MSAKAALRRTAVGVALLVAFVAVGCATGGLERAREEFYRGRVLAAEQTLNRGVPVQDRVLYLMERGTIRLFAGDYEASARDYIEAYEKLVELETYSVTRGGASMVINDTVQEFRGFPYERSLLHAFTAKSHLALGKWEHAAVEARRLIESLSPDMRGDYPEDAYSRYMAGFCLELVGDLSNARVQYRRAAELAPQAGIDPETGRFGDARFLPTEIGGSECELVVFVLMGRAPRIDSVVHPDEGYYAEIYADGRYYLGRSYLLADTAQLASISFQKDAARRIAKTAARVATKEIIARQLERENELLGALARFLLIGVLEKPDTRRWETLPRFLHVARVTCAADLKNYTIVFKSGSGATLARRTVMNPLQRNGRLFVSFARDVAAPPGG